MTAPAPAPAHVPTGTVRHAIYFAPEADHPLWAAGCDWLGRPRDGIGAGAPARAGVATPWRYGFHATLKAPMRLAPGLDEAGLRAALQGLARQHRAFTLPALAVDRLGGFLALRPVLPLAPDHPLRRLADDAVQALDAWRMPLTPAEAQRQLRAAHSPRQQAQVGRWGYAHVLDDWRFHLTLSDDLADSDPALLDRLLQQAQPHFAAALRQPVVCRSLCLFTEPAPGAPFECRARVALMP